METTLDPALEAKRARLDARLRALPSCLVAFSGGVDSSVLLHAAHAALGARAAGFLADSASLPRAELDRARDFAGAIGARLFVRRTGELEDERYRRNTPERCYFCKRTLFEEMAGLARAEGFAALAFGEITDDLGDVRPGARAARELSVLAPLSEAGFSKEDVRAVARAQGWPVADKPAAACLASRLPHGTPVTRERLARVEAAEGALLALGLRQVRVRDHGTLARVEVGPDELARAEALRAPLEAALAAAGFARLELGPYRRGGRDAEPAV